MRVSSIGIAENVWKGYISCVLTFKFINKKVTDTPKKVIKREIHLFLKQLFKVVSKVVLPRVSTTLR